MLRGKPASACFGQTARDDCKDFRGDAQAFEVFRRGPAQVARVIAGTCRCVADRDQQEFMNSVAKSLALDQYRAKLAFDARAERCLFPRLAHDRRLRRLAGLDAAPW